MVTQTTDNTIPHELRVDWHPEVTPDLERPELFYDRVRAIGGVAWSDRIDAWVVTEHHLITEIATDTDTFSSANAVPPLESLPADVLETMAEAGSYGVHAVQVDPPSYHEMRKLGAEVFRGKVIDNAIPYMQETAADLIANWGDSLDLVSEFSSPFVHRVLNRLIGVEDEDMARADAWNDAFLGLLAPTVPHEAKRVMARQFVDYSAYLTELLERRRVEPRDDMTSALVQAYERSGKSFEDALPDMRMFLRGLWAGGIHTTKDLITSCVYTFLSAPDRAPWLTLGQDRSAIMPHVEEVLRLLAPHRGLFRITTKDTVVNGVSIKKDQQILLLFGAGNLDGAIFENPSEFTPGRSNAGKHLAFGHGVHRCIGIVLARRETNVAIEELVTRVPQARIAPDYEPEWAPEFFFRGLQRLALEH